MTLVELLEQARSTEEQRLAHMAAQLEVNVRYVQSDPMFPKELPDLPDGTVIELGNTGFTFTLPKGEDPNTWFDALLAAGFERQSNSNCTVWKGDHAQTNDSTGHQVSVWNYATFTILVANK